MVSSSRAATCIAAALAVCSPLASAFSVPSSPHPARSTPLAASPHEEPITAVVASADPTRREFLAAIATASATAAFAAPALAADSKESLVADLNDSLGKIQAIPSLLEGAEWDKVRTILKTPPVNQLWNLGESQNTLVKLAKETGEFELMEVKDELAISLQMTDQYSYDNVFIYYQPGNGKVKTKEPLEMANKAIGQLKDAINMASSS